MKLHRKRDLGKSGIYLIRNLVNGKVYIGKAKCIYKRMKDHITRLNTKDKDENPHLINSWHKHGKENFEYVVLEYLPLDEVLIKERELFWIKSYNSLEREKGYNLRLDSSTGLIILQETRDKMRASRYRALKDPDIKAKCSHTFWKDNPKALAQMAKAVALLNVKYFIDQYSGDGLLPIKRWESIREVMEAHPEYKKHNIYAVCSGEKKRMYGFHWKKVLKG